MVPQVSGSARPPGLDVPPRHPAAALQLLDDIEQVRAGSDELMRGIEDTTGLRLLEVRVLEEVAQGADHIREIARRSRQPVEAARATADTLLTREMLGRHHHPEASGTAGPAMLHVTDAGVIVLEQVNAMRLRITDALLSALGHDEAERLRHTMRAFSSVLTSEQPAVGARRTRQAPRPGRELPPLS